MIYLVIGISIAVICSVAGDFYVKEGSAQVRTPPVASFGGIKGLLNPVTLLRFLRQSTIFSWKLTLGIILLSFFFGGFIMAMDAAPVTLVVPLMSFTYVLSTLIGKFVLHEHVTWLRWAGVLTVISGIILLVVFGNFGPEG